MRLTNHAVGFVDVTVHEDSEARSREAARRRPLTSARGRQRFRNLYSFRISAAPSAVAPPWFPIAGTTNAARRVPLSVLADFLTTIARLSMPRLPAAMAIRACGRITHRAPVTALAARRADRRDARVESLPDFESWNRRIWPPGIEIGCAPWQHLRRNRTRRSFKEFPGNGQFCKIRWQPCARTGMRACFEDSSPPSLTVPKRFCRQSLTVV